MMGVNYDRIISSVPLDRTAAVATSQGGCNDEEDIGSRSKCVVHSAYPLPTRQPWFVELRNPSFRDLAGGKFGHFTVIGIFDRGKRGRMVWVVRCVCGRYEVRTKRALTNPLAEGDKCEECLRTEYHSRKSRPAKIFHETGDGMYAVRERGGM